VFVIVGVTAASFAMLFITGDPALAMAGDQWTPEQIDQFRRDMGFDRPWIVQYGEFLWRAVQGDFGVSLRQRQPTFTLIMERMPATLELAFAALVISVVVALPIGIISASRRNSAADNLGMLFALIGQSVPVFWLGLMLILVFGVYLRVLPVAGRGSWEHLILPAFSLATFSLARNARIIRSSLLEVLGQDYVRTARAKGLRERVVLYQHALRNALIPVVTLIGLEFGTLLGGAIITETIFAWPGVGRLTVQAIFARDLPLVQTAVTVLATVFVLLNLLVDLLYTYLDPRIKLE
jgi:peptide/nickel transport system permease protein